MRRKAFLGLMIATIFWGGGFVATSIALKEIPVIMTLAIRFLGSALVLFLIGFNKIRKTSLIDLLKGVPLGTLLFTAFFFQTMGNGMTSVANNSFLTALNVVFTPFIAMFFLSQKPTRSDYLASLVAFTGVAVLTLANLSFKLNFGDIFSLIGAIFFSTHVVYSSKHQNLDTLTTTFVQMFVAGIIALTIATFTNQVEFMTTSIQSSLSIVYLIIFSTLICYSLQLFASKHLSPSEVSVLLSTEALFATLFGALILKEAITLQSSASMALLLSAVYISNNGNEKALQAIQD